MEAADGGNGFWALLKKGFCPKKNGKDKGYIYSDAFEEEVPNTLFKEELIRINLFREGDSKRDSTRDCVGLAFSGGGIRSATFNLGVLQALSRNGWLKHADYLSTVSGGGYIGSCLTWLLHKEWEVNKNNNSKKIQWNTGEGDFPFGTSREKSHQDWFSYKQRILRYLRQHGNYLTPGRGITRASLLAAYLRGVVVNIFVFFPLVTLIFLIGAGIEKVFTGMDTFKIFGEFLFSWNWAIWLGVILVAIFFIFSLLYSAVAFYRSIINPKPGYQLRRGYERKIKYALLFAGFFFIMGAIPYIHGGLIDFFSNAGSIAAITTSLVSFLMGLVSVAQGFNKSGEKGPQNTRLWVLAGSVLLILGFLLAGYHYSKFISPELKNGASSSTICWFVTCLLLGIAVGVFSNRNLLSVHRYYRDRLMETYMPNVRKILGAQGGKSSKRAGLGDLADEGLLSEMCGSSLPYHLINTNVVLVDSDVPKSKGRGGDNFILSPLYCGSQATGWCETKKFMDNQMTLPTAMAISGAALNPNTGVGGEGLSRNRFVSLVMQILNLSLGYWIRHPNPANYRLWKFPNQFWGLLGVMKEEEKLLLLTDGGHFENTGLYELLRRELPVIIASDAGADEKFTFEDLGNLVEKVRVDFGIEIDIDLQPLVPKKSKKEKYKTAERGFTVGLIRYGKNASGKEKLGFLIFLKTTYISGLQKDVVGYKALHKEFPDQTTGDQWFDEKQFEAYRELGFQVADSMVKNLQANNMDKYFRKAFPQDKNLEKSLEELQGELWRLIPEKETSDG